jgi:hypothetical protein
MWNTIGKGSESRISETLKDEFMSNNQAEGYDE